MSQGFQRKIDIIVDNIVESEKNKNNKIDENDISESIKKVISNLNDIGKILVLDDLKKESGQTPSKLLTIDGKISIDKLNEVVEAKINEASREGIDLKADTQQMFRNSSVLVSEGILTTATLHIMASNFSDLSREQQIEVIGNWEKLTSEDRLSILDDLDSHFKKNRDNYTQEENKILDEAIETSKKVENMYNLDLNGLTNDQILKLINARLENKSEAEKRKVTDMLKMPGISYQNIWNYLNGETIKLEKEKIQLLEASNPGEKSTFDRISQNNLEVYKEWSNIEKYFIGHIEIAETPEKKKKLEELLKKHRDFRSAQRKNSASHVKIKEQDLENNEMITVLNALKIDMPINELLNLSEGKSIYNSTALYLNLLEKGLLTKEEFGENVKQYRNYIANSYAVEKRNKVLSKEEREHAKADSVSKITSELNKTNSIVYHRLKRKLEKGEITEEEYNKEIKNVSELNTENKEKLQIKNEINQIPIALIKLGISPEQVKTNLYMYTDFLEKLDTNDIQKLKSLNPKTLNLYLNKQLKKFGINEQMAGILSEINFNKQLFNILGDEEKKKEFFEQFDKAINQEHIQDGTEPLTEELEEIFSKYFRDNAVDIHIASNRITEEKQQVTQEQEPKDEQAEIYSFSDLKSLQQDSVENMDSILEEELTDEARAELEAKDYFGKDFVESFERLKEKLTKNKVQLRIHGTSDKETAENIEKEGLLIYGTPTLKMTSYDNFSYSSMQHWPHKDSKHLVLIGVPDEATKASISGENTELTSDSERFESKPLFTVEHSTMNNNDTSSYRLPSEFIVGYIDVENKEILFNPQYKSEHVYEDLYVTDSELGTSPEVDLSLFGQEEDLKWLNDFGDIDGEVTPEDRKKATEVITHKKEHVHEPEDIINSLSEDDWRNGWD